MKLRQKQYTRKYPIAIPIDNNKKLEEEVHFKIDKGTLFFKSYKHKRWTELCNITSKSIVPKLHFTFTTPNCLLFTNSRTILRVSNNFLGSYLITILLASYA